MSEDKDKYQDVPMGKDGKPTRKYMEWAFQNDKELFLDLQNEYFTTKGTMKDNMVLDKIKSMFKSDKKEKK